MIHFLFGSYGSGKTTAVMEAIRQDTEAGHRTFLIVPEQEAVQSERATLELLPPSAGQYLEVLNFSRLYNRVCREYGGLCYRYITKPIRHLLMWKNLRELAPLLESYAPKGSDELAMAELMLSALGELKSCAITPEELELASSKLRADDPFAPRLRDLALIFASYDRLVAEHYSDSADDLSRLYQVLQREPFFAKSHVYLDSFTSFTAMEHKIIERIFATAEQVTVTVPLPSPTYRDMATKSVEQSLRRLLRAASLYQEPEYTVLEESHRAKTAMLRTIPTYIWEMDPSKLPKVPADGSVITEICDTPYAEAEAASAHILELLRRGERCRDILILMRDPEQYRGILEPALEKNDIPYFFSEKTDLCTLPPVKLLFSALRIKQFHWQKNDIISHIKTGMYDFSMRDMDLFEEYMNTWGIKGARFTDGDWTMNPDGFAEALSPRGEGILICANLIRRSLTEMLERFFILLDAAKAVPDQCRAVYDYFCHMGMEKRLEELAATEAQRGNRKRAEEYSRLYGLLLNTLADIAAALPEEEADTEEFLQILHAVFSQTDIGTIPTSVDEVTIGSAATLRASNPKYTFILGLCEGEFPATVKDSGIFTSSDRKDLSAMGIELSGDADSRSSDELMFVRRAMASPSHGLYLFTSTSKTDGKERMASLPFGRIGVLFPDLKPHRYVSSDLRYLAGSPKSATSRLRLLANSPEGTALAKALEERMPSVTEAATASPQVPHCTVDPSLLPEFSRGSFVFSFSRFEKYVSCPFSYYGSYVLGLREKKTSSFQTNTMGTLIHYVLEQLIRYATEEDENGKLPSDEDLVSKTQETVREYIARICPEELKRSRRLHHLYARLERLALLTVQNIVEEFSHSRFRPAFFELCADGKNGNPQPMEITLKDGFRVTFSGIIDRVDVFRKDQTVYVRVIDYKTGSKTFSLDDLEHGMNLQMLIYLFTLCRNRSNAFTEALELPDGESLSPAGVVYLSTNISPVSSDGSHTEEQIRREASAALSRTGLLLDDPEILHAMNDELSSCFLAGIRQLKDGTIKGSALTSSEKFNALYDQIESTIQTIIEELRSGNASATPLIYGKNNPCTYCAMKPVCRRTESSEP